MPQPPPEEPIRPGGSSSAQARLAPDQQAEIEEARARTAGTRRVVAPGLEEVLYTAFPVLDRGFVRVVDYMGDDAAVVQAARVSYGRGTRSLRDDAGLIRYLLRHRHTTPFEMCEIKLHVKLPIFVARQWIRHRTANVNEYSARYSRMDREFHIPDAAYLEQRVHRQQRQGDMPDLFDSPTLSAVGAQSTENRQGRGDPAEREADKALSRIDWLSKIAYGVYENLLNKDESGKQIRPGEAGLARELARAVLPVNYYTQWYWKTDLHNLLHFLSLRADDHAQYEIRAYAEVILNEVVKRWVPLTYQAFRDYRVDAVSLSAPALAVVRRLLAGERVTREDSGLSARECRELEEALALQLER